MKEREFAASVRDWLGSIISQGIPEPVVALCFNLFEYSARDRPGTSFAMELIGAGHFDHSDPHDPDWRCNLVWRSGNDLQLPRELVEEEWEAALDLAHDIVADILLSRGRLAAALKSKEAVGIGFGEGDLILLWSRTPPRKNW